VLFPGNGQDVSGTPLKLFGQVVGICDLNLFESYFSLCVLLVEISAE
jgi:hypothetical protein